MKINTYKVSFFKYFFQDIELFSQKLMKRRNEIKNFLQNLSCANL